MKRWLWVALAFATLIKLYLALYTHGSLDVAGFRDHLDKIHELGVGAYRVRGAFDNPFNSPPPMIHVIKFWGWLSQFAPFGFWLRLPGILADICSFFLVSRLLAKLWPDRSHFWALLGMILCPTAILISGYHGNTDSVMIFLVLLSIYFNEKPWAGLIFGLALCVKVLPLAFAPAIIFCLPWKKSFRFFSLAAATFILCSMPYLAQDPSAVGSTVFGYSSIYGEWGFTQLATLFFPDPPSYLHGAFDVQGSHLIFAQILKIVLMGAIIFTSFRFRKNLYLACGIITGLLLFLAPGFGTQYLVWLVPFVPALGLCAMPYYVTSGLYTFIFYSYTFIFYSCIGLFLSLHPAIFVLFALACWVSILLTIVRYYHLLQEGLTLADGETEQNASR